MANKNKESVTDTNIEIIDEVVEEIVEDFVEESEETVETVEETVEEVIDEDNNTVTHTTKLGTVFNCDRLNVRARPDALSEVVSILEAGSEVIINEKKSSNEFYNVSTSAGIEGFCMSRYISRATLRG